MQSTSQDVLSVRRFMTLLHHSRGPSVGEKLHVHTLKRLNCMDAAMAKITTVDEYTIKDVHQI